MNDDDEFKDAFQTEEKIEKYAKDNEVQKKENLITQESNINLEDIKKEISSLEFRRKGFKAQEFLKGFDQKEKAGAIKKVYNEAKLKELLKKLNELASKKSFHTSAKKSSEITAHDVEKAMNALKTKHIEKYDICKEGYNNTMQDVLRSTKIMLEYIEKLAQKNIKDNSMTTILKNCYENLTQAQTSIEALYETQKYVMNQLDQEKRPKFLNLKIKEKSFAAEIDQNTHVEIGKKADEYITDISSKVRIRDEALRHARQEKKNKQKEELIGKRVKNMFDDLVNEEIERKMTKSQKFARSVINVGKKIGNWTGKVSKAAKSVARKISGRGRG